MIFATSHKYPPFCPSSSFSKFSLTRWTTTRKRSTLVFKLSTHWKSKLDFSHYFNEDFMLLLISETWTVFWCCFVIANGSIKSSYVTKCHLLQSNFSLIQPSFVKFVQIAQFHKTSHAWQLMELVIGLRHRCTKSSVAYLGEYQTCNLRVWV